MKPRRHEDLMTPGQSDLAQPRIMSLEGGGLGFLGCLDRTFLSFSRFFWKALDLAEFE